MNSEEIKRKDKEKIVATYSRFDMVAERGKGVRCVSADGKEYLDLTAGIGVNSLGLCDDGWIKAVTEQLNKLQHMSNLFYTEPQVRVAEMLTERTGLKKVFFGNSGGEANEMAIKTARKYGTVKKGIKENKIITLKNSFHGRTIATITATGQEHYHEFFAPFAAGFEYCDVGDVQQLQRLIDDDTCAVMMEVIQGEGGVLDLDKGFVKAVEETCRERGVLLIVDEVQSGIGRTGKLFAYEHFGIRPDIVTFAKGIGGGLPMGGAIFAESCCDVMEPGNHGATFGGNPVACAGAIEVLTRMDEKFLEDVARKGEHLKAELLEIPQVEEVTGIGLMLGVKIKGKEARQLAEDALKVGLMVLTAKDRIRLLPSLTITDDELDEGIELFKEALAE